jgi:hypothetical protein
MASVSRSLDLTGSDWGLRKKHKDRHREKLGSGRSDTLLMRDAGNTLCLHEHLFIQQVWESGVKCRSSSHRSSCIGGRNRASMVCCYLVQTILTRPACPVFLARQPCWILSPLGWVCAYQPRGLWQSCAFCYRNRKLTQLIKALNRLFLSKEDIQMVMSS